MTSREREQIWALKACTVDAGVEMGERDRDFIRHMAHVASNNGLLALSEARTRYLRALLVKYSEEMSDAGKRDLIQPAASKKGVLTGA